MTTPAAAHSSRLLAQRRSLLAARQRLQCRAYATPVPSRPQEKDPQLGDYPQLPDVSRQHLPPTGWWDNQTRRNYGDILHEREEMYSMWGPDAPSIPPRTALFQFGIAASLFLGIALFAKATTPERESIPREYPFSGLVKELGGLEENKALEERIDGEDEE